MKGINPLASAVLCSFCGLLFGANLALAQAPDPDVLAQLKAAIEADEVVKIETVTQQAADLVFVGPIQDDVARGIVSVPVPIPNVSHMTLRVVQPGGAVAHTATLENEDRWGGVFSEYKFGIELYGVGIQAGAILVVDLYQGGKAVAHAEKELPEQTSRPDYVVDNFVVLPKGGQLELSYDFTNLALQPVTVIPQVTITNQNIEEGKVLLQKYLSATSVPAKTVEPLVHEAVLPTEPGLYEAVMWLFDEDRQLLTGALRQTFVVEGAYGVFESVELYTDEESGDSRLIVKGGATGTQESLSLVVLAEPVINGSVSRALVDKVFEIELTAAQRFREDIDINLSRIETGRLKGQVQMRAGDKIIAEKDFNFIVGGEKVPEAVVPAGEDGPSLLPFTEGLEEGKAQRWVLILLGVILFLVLLWLFVRWRKKRSKMLMALGMLLLGGTAWAQSTTLVNTWYYPLENWIYNPLATGEFENFRYLRFEGNVFNPLTQEGFFQLAPDSILVRFVSGVDDLYSQAFVFTISDNKKYQFDIAVPTSLAEGAWEIELYFQYQGSFYQTSWEDEITAVPYTVSVDKTEPTLQEFTYDGVTYTPGNKLVWPGVEGLEDDETTLLQQRKIHFLDRKANELVRKDKRRLRKAKIRQYNDLIGRLPQEEQADNNGVAGADPSQIAGQISALALQIDGLSRELGEMVPGSELFTISGDVETPVDNTVTANTVLTGNTASCPQDTENAGQTPPNANSSNACINFHQAQIATLSPQIALKRSEIRTAKTRFKNSGIGVQFVCDDSGAGCNPSCNVANGQCDIDCSTYPQSCAAYQVANSSGYSANCAGSPLSCAVDCTVDPDICRMRGLVADVRGNFCEDDVYCDDTATRKFQACDNVGNCLDLSTEAVETDWYDPVKPDLGGLKITRNKGDIDGDETILNLETTEAGDITVCQTLGSGFAGGDGSPGDPYQICDIDQLQNIQTDLDADYVLINNIDASATSGWNGGQGFDPITGFTGNLDGQDHIVKDLFINRSAESNVGLFGTITPTTPLVEVSNLGVIDADITGGNYTGGLIGNGALVNLTRVYARGQVSGAGSVGGLMGGAGYLTGSGAIINSYAAVDVVGSGNNVGGLVGNWVRPSQGSAGAVIRSYASGDVAGVTYVGGLIGAATDNGAVSNMIVDSYAGGSVTGTSFVGGLMGRNTMTSSIDSSYYLGDVSASGASVGGLVGEAVSGATVNESYFLQTASINNSLVVDASSLATINNSFGVSDVLLDAAGSSSDSSQPFFGWSDAVWDFGTINEAPTLLSSPSFNEDIAGVSGTLAAADRFSFEIAASDVENPNANTHPDLFDTHACGSSSVDGFFLGDESDPACSQRYTACALSSNLRGVKDNLLGTACQVNCPTVTYDIDGQIITETYQRQGDLCVPTCDYRLFDGCFPFLLIGETCENLSWLPLETSIDEGVVFTQTSNCGDTRDWVGTKPITQSIKHFLDGKDVFGVYFYDTFDDGPGFTDIAYRGQFNIDTDGFAQDTSGAVTADWQHEVGYSPEGGKVLKIESTSLSGGYAAWERTGIPVTPSTDYILTYWVKTNSVTNRNSSGAWPVIYENGSNNISAQYAATMKAVSDSFTWEKVEVPFTTGGGVSTIDIEMRLEAQDGRIAYFDDVVVQEENWRFDATQSWYSETKGDAGDGVCDYITGDGDGDPRGGADVRCGTDYFPEKSVIALTTDGLWMLDAVDGVMWMSALEQASGFAFVFSSLKSGTPFASNAKLFSGFQFDSPRNGAMAIADFITDSMYTHRMSDCFTLAGVKGTGPSYSNSPCIWGSQNIRVWNGFVNDGLVDRNVDRGNYWSNVLPPGSNLANHQINHMHSNVVGGVEYIVLAHDYAGITILNKGNNTVQYIEFDGSSHSGFAWDYYPSTANDYRAVYLADDGKLYYLWDRDGDTRTRLHVIADVRTLPFNGSVLSGTSSYDYRIQPNNSSASYPTTALGDEADALDVKDERVLIGSDSGFDLYRGDMAPGSQHPDLAKQRVSRSYASAPLFRDVWGHWVTSVQDVSGKANDMTAVGSVSLSVTNVGSDLQQFNFNNDAYLQSSTGAFASIGNELTIGTWVYTDSVAEDGGYLIAQKDAVDTEFALYRTADNKLRVEGATSHTIDAYTLDGWNFVAATFDGTTKRAYIDGVKVLEVADVVGTASGGASLDPSNITYLDQFDDNSGNDSIDAATAVEIVGNLAYVTARNGDALQIFDISDPANINYLGGYRDTTLLDRAYDVAVSGNYAYVAVDRRDSLAVIDVSNPASPSFVTELQGNNFNGARGVVVEGNYAYVANRNDDSLAVVDISNPLSPVQVGEYDSNSNMDRPVDVQVSGNYAYLTAENSDALVVIDISDPANPTYVSRYRNTSLLDSPRAVAIRGNYAYVASAFRNAMTVIDISNPASLTWVAEVRDNSALEQAHGIALSGDYAYVAAYEDDSLQVINIANPASPVWIGEFASNDMNGAHDVEVVGDKIFVASYVDDSLVTLDIGETVAGLRLKLGAGEDSGGTNTKLDGALALPFVTEEAYSDDNVKEVYNGTRDWFGENILVTLQGTSDEIVDLKFGDFGSYFIATDGGGITHFDYSGRVLRTISAAPTSESNVSIVSNNISTIDYRNGWLIIGYIGRGVEIVNIAPEVSEILSKYDEAEYDPYFFY